MERYDYLEAVTADAKAAILEHINDWDFNDREELKETANENLWDDDAVTGNASGSYYCNAWQAEEALCHNWDLLEEAADEMDADGQYLDELFRSGAESCDVTIRCYLLWRAISAAIDDLEEEGKIAYPCDEEEDDEDENYAH